MQRNPSLYLHIHCRAINILISHDQVPSDLVAQSVKVVGSIPTLVRVSSIINAAFWLVELLVGCMLVAKSASIFVMFCFLRKDV